MPDADVPHCRERPPWCVCGDPGSADFGTLFAWPGTGTARALSFDRQGRRHALTVFGGVELGAEVTLHGRRFDVVAGDPAEWRL